MSVQIIKGHESIQNKLIASKASRGAIISIDQIVIRASDGRLEYHGASILLDEEEMEKLGKFLLGGGGI